MANPHREWTAGERSPASPASPAAKEVDLPSDDELDALPRYARPRDPRHLQSWREDVRALRAESPLRDLLSCGIEARDEVDFGDAKAPHPRPAKASFL